MNLLKEMDLAYCDVCGNYVPTIEIDGDLLCALEYAEYPYNWKIVRTHKSR